MNWYETQWAKRGYVALGALLVFVLDQFAAKGVVDLQAVAGEFASQLKGLLVGATTAWLLTDRPSIMRPKEVEEDVP